MNNSNFNNLQISLYIDKSLMYINKLHEDKLVKIYKNK